MTDANQMTEDDLRFLAILKREEAKLSARLDAVRVAIEAYELILPRQQDKIICRPSAHPRGVLDPEFDEALA